MDQLLEVNHGDRKEAVYSRIQERGRPFGNGTGIQDNRSSQELGDPYQCFKPLEAAAGYGGQRCISWQGASNPVSNFEMS